MILADTSIWIDHLRAGNEELSDYLRQGHIVMHPFVVAELALGCLRERAKILVLLDSLPKATMAGTDEVRHMIEARNLYRHGIGLIDAHLLASALINPPTVLWTRDKPLRRVTEVFGIHIAVA